MNPTSEVQQAKSKANGKWATIQDVVKEGEKIAEQGLGTSAVGQELVGFVQDHAEDLVKSAGDIAKSASDRIVKFAKTYPVQTIIAGVAVAVVAGPYLMARRKN